LDCAECFPQFCRDHFCLVRPIQIEVEKVAQVPDVIGFGFLCKWGRVLCCWLPESERPLIGGVEAFCSVAFQLEELEELVGMME